MSMFQFCKKESGSDESGSSRRSDIGLRLSYKRMINDFQLTFRYTLV